MTKDKALKLALEALENNQANWQGKDKAITAIKEALAQHNEFNPDWDAMVVMVEEQQRMAKRIAELEAQPEQKVDWEKLYRLEVKKKEALAAKYERDIKPLTKIVPMAQPEQEPVAWMDEEINCAYTPEELDGGTAEGLIPLYTAPPQRKPLTDDEIRNLWDGHVVPVFGKNGINPIVFARAIEAKLKQKNGYAEEKNT